MMENMVLNLPKENKFSKYKNKKNENFSKNEELDILQIGHLLYEMAFGYPADNIKPQISKFSFLDKK